ncbi:hypothetical protein SUGI_0602710 [Cryptomeria japonica]|nr:hypothetical protein SUGI_0602710 [Cryptomeria japonica]
MNNFSGNKGLGANEHEGNLISLSPCAAAAAVSPIAGSHARTLIVSFFSVASVITFVISWVLYKKMYKAPESQESWDFKSFHRVTITEDDILHCLKEENVISSSGSGKVYKGELSNGEKIAVKQLWNSKTA